MELISDIKSINKAIASIKATGKKLDDKIQLVALSACAHLQEHHNVTPVNDLFNALPNGARRSALQAWLLKFGGVIVNSNKESAAAGMHFKGGKDLVFDIEGGAATPWYALKPEPTPLESLNVYSKVAALVRAVQKARDAGVAVTVSDEDMQALIRMSEQVNK